MDQTTLLYIMAGAVVVSAIALVIQMALMFGMYKATVTLRDRAMTMMPKVDALMDSSKITIEEGRATIAEIREKSNLILESGHKQVKHLETLLSDASERTNRQMAHAEAVVEDTLARLEGTVQMVHRGVLKPLRGISGVAAGVTAAVQYLMSRRPNLERATLDEEMFI